MAVRFEVPGITVAGGEYIELVCWRGTFRDLAALVGSQRIMQRD